mmetsp:Transcript_10756/g.48830  ORF Transcript_10756/g.48830 Transcript_10756/m.48830 type:complete len:371 (-) Transcript_10756:849-1961(-)
MAPSRPPASDTRYEAPEFGTVMVSNKSSLESPRPSEPYVPGGASTSPRPISTSLKPTSADDKVPSPTSRSDSFNRAPVSLPPRSSRTPPPPPGVDAPDPPTPPPSAPPFPVSASSFMNSSSSSSPSPLDDSSASASLSCCSARMANLAAASATACAAAAAAASLRLGPRDGGGRLSARALFSAHDSSRDCMTSQASNAYGSSCVASAPPSAAITATLCSSAPLSSSPNSASSAVRVYLANKSQAPPSDSCELRGQSTPRVDRSTHAGFDRFSMARTGVGTALSLCRLSSVRRATLRFSLRRSSSLWFCFSIFWFSRLATTSFPSIGSMGRLRTVRRSASLSGVKHIGHLAGSPSFLSLTVCRAMHGKQNA